MASRHKRLNFSLRPGRELRPTSSIRASKTGSLRSVAAQWGKQCSWRLCSARWMALFAFVQSAHVTCTGRRLRPMKRKVPKLKTDAEAERFLARDLSDLDFSQFKPANFEFEKKSARVNMRLPETLLKAVKA